MSVIEPALTIGEPETDRSEEAIPTEVTVPVPTKGAPLKSRVFVGEMLRARSAVFELLRQAIVSPYVRRTTPVEAGLDTNIESFISIIAL